MNRFERAALATVLSACLSTAWAHGGEDHDHDAAPAAPPAPLSSEWAAQSSTATESFEMVMVLSKNDPQPVLTLYIDRFSTNEPLRDATVEVESEQFKGTAKAVAPGVYQMSGQAFSKPGQHPVTVSIQTSQDTDLLDVMLNTPQTETEQHEHGSPSPIRTGLWAWAGLITLVVVGLIIRRRMATRTSQDLA